MKTRRSFTLVELTVVLSACAVILTTSAMLVHRAMHTQSNTQSFLDLQRSALRLCAQFRADVHRANTAEVRDDSSDESFFVRLHGTDDQMIEYHQDGETVVRTSSKEEGPQAREEFDFGTAIDLSIREESAPDRLILLIVSQPDGTASGPEMRPRISRGGPVSLQVEASLDRDGRFLSDASTAEESE